MLNIFYSFLHFLQVWFKNRRAKCRQQAQQQQNGGTPAKPKPVKRKSPPRDSPTTPTSEPSYNSKSPPTPTTMPNNNTIWSPAAIGPSITMSEPLSSSSMTNSSCMQHASAYPMHNAQTAGGYPQGYHQSSYFSNLDYLPPVPQFSQMTPPPMNGNHMGSAPSQIPSHPSHHASMATMGSASMPSMTPTSLPNSTDCVENKDQSSSWKFQVL